MKICIPSSAGGHLTEVLSLKKFLDKNDTFYVVPDEKRPRSLLKGKGNYFIKDPKRNLLRMLSLFVKAKRILKKEKPDVIITTGSGIAYPFCKLAKKRGTKVIFIESICRTRKKSFSGRLIYPLSDVFFVQWEGMKKLYPKAIYAGRVF